MGINLGPTPATPSGSTNILQQIADGISAAGGIGPALAQFVGGMVQGLANTIGGLFGPVFGQLAAFGGDTAAGLGKVEAARAKGETAVAAQMSASVDKLDLVMRCGGVYVSDDWSYYRVTQGDNTPHIFPVTNAFNLMRGTKWDPPAAPVSVPSGYVVPDSDYQRWLLSRRTGFLEITEGGLWTIMFQTSVRPYNGWGGVQQGPTRSWCYVTPASSPHVPFGDVQVDTQGSTYPAGTAYITAYSYAENVPDGGNPSLYIPKVDGFLLGYGRTTAYGGSTTPAGGYTALGFLPVYLPSGGYKVSLATQNDWHYGGSASTYVWAQKINSEALASEIANLKTAFTAAFPGQQVDYLLSNSANQARLQAAADAANAAKTLGQTVGTVNPYA